MSTYNKEVLASSSFFDLPEELMKTLKQNAEFKTLKRGDLFSQAGELQDKFFFLEKGIARAYIIDENGKEFTRSLFVHPTAIASMNSIITQQEATVNYDCLTDCELYIGDFGYIMKLAKTNLVIAEMYAKMLEKAYLRMEYRVYELSLPAKEKYDLLRKRIPNIDNLIPQYQIASYLNITPVQLSRIRRKK